MIEMCFCQRRWIVCLLLLMGSVLWLGCSTPQRTWVYPTDQEQEVSLVCDKVYNPEYAPYTLNSRLSPISRFISLENRILVFFSDGNRVILPMETDLPVGEEFACGARLKHYPCLPGTNQDPNCTRKRL